LEERSEGKECDAAVAAAGAAMVDAGDDLPAPVPSLFKLTTLELGADAVAASNKAAGLAMLHQPGVNTALRTAMHIAGNREVLPPAATRSWLAEHYIHERIVVDEHTAGAVLYEALSQFAD